MSAWKQKTEGSTRGLLLKEPFIIGHHERTVLLQFGSIYTAAWNEMELLLLYSYVNMYEYLQPTYISDRSENFHVVLILHRKGFNTSVPKTVSNEDDD